MTFRATGPVHAPLMVTVTGLEMRNTAVSDSWSLATISNVWPHVVSSFHEEDRPTTPVTIRVADADVGAGVGAGVGADADAVVVEVVVVVGAVTDDAGPCCWDCRKSGAMTCQLVIPRPSGVRMHPEPPRTSFKASGSRLAVYGRTKSSEQTPRADSKCGDGDGDGDGEGDGDGDGTDTTAAAVSGGVAAETFSGTNRSFGVGVTDALFRSESKYSCRDSSSTTNT